MFTNHPILDFFDYICARNAQCWARITKSNMEIQRYNRLKIVLAEKELARGSQSRWAVILERFHDGWPIRFSHQWNSFMRLRTTLMWMWRSYWFPLKHNASIAIFMVSDTASVILPTIRTRSGKRLLLGWCSESNLTTNSLYGKHTYFKQHRYYSKEDARITWRLWRFSKQMSFASKFHYWRFAIRLGHYRWNSKP